MQVGYWFKEPDPSESHEGWSGWDYALTELMVRSGHYL